MDKERYYDAKKQRVKHTGKNTYRGHPANENCLEALNSIGMWKGNTCINDDDGEYSVRQR